VLGGDVREVEVILDPERSAALERVRVWTRTRFALPEDAAILVAQVACSLPGCPPLETAVAFWTDGPTRHQFKLFKPVAEVVEDDLPPSWMKPALIVGSDVPRQAFCTQFIDTALRGQCGLICGRIVQRKGRSTRTSVIKL